MMNEPLTELRLHIESSEQFPSQTYPADVHSYQKLYPMYLTGADNSRDGIVEEAIQQNCF